jgi:hypothetical protein
MEKLLLRATVCILLTIIVIFVASPTAWSHFVDPGTLGASRAEYVFQPFPTSADNVNTVQGHIERGNNPISGSGSWTWMAVSMSQIAAGTDCHTGNIAAPNYKVVRVGWMKYNHPNWGNGDQPYMMAAWQTSTGPQLFKYIPFDQMYPMKVRQPLPGGPEEWAFQRYRWDTSQWETFACIGCGMIPGIHPAFKCATYGGWASSNSHNMGNVGILYPIFRSTFTGGTYNNVPLDGASWHGVLAAQYTFGIGTSPIPTIQVQDTN